MNEENLEERTEEPSEQRLREAREKGQVLRSRDLTGFIVLMCSILLFYFFSSVFMDDFKKLNQEIFYSIQSFDKNLLISSSLKKNSFNLLFDLFFFISSISLVSIVSTFALGGMIFSYSHIKPNFSRISMISGLSRIFSLNTIFELFKSLLKVFVLITFTYLLSKNRYLDILNMINYSVDKSIYVGVKEVFESFFFIALSLVIVVGIDLPFQIYQHFSKLKMTKQELRQEYKESEGRPEVKSKIKELQKQYSKKRMMDEVPKADVVLINPTHYSVALKYDQSIQSAPIVVAKGADFMAMQIQTVAKENKVTMISSPPLTRAIYYSTALNREIPSGLYLAVAQILAYVYQLKKYYYIGGEKPTIPVDLPIPEELRK